MRIEQPNVLGFKLLSRMVLGLMFDVAADPGFLRRADSKRSEAILPIEFVN